MRAKLQKKKRIREMGVLVILGMFISILIVSLPIAASDDLDWETDGTDVWTGYGNGYPEGNVGIGTNVPGKKLDVVGEARISSDLIVDTDTLYVDASSHKVGIGLVGPNDELEVVGDASADRFVARTGSTTVEFADQDGTDGIKIVNSDSNPIIWIGGYSVLPIDFRGIYMDGALKTTSIGTVDSRARLVVSSLDNNDDAVRLLGPDGGTIAYGARLNFGDEEYVYIEEDLDDKLYIYSRLRTAIMGGNVGIGTTSPDRLLHAEVSDAQTNTVTYGQRISHITSETAGPYFGTGIEFELEDAGGGNDIAASIEAIWSTATGGSEESKLLFKTTDVGDDNLAPRMTIDKDGRVGIGTIYPSNLLHVGSGAIDIFNSNPSILADTGIGIDGNSAKIMIGNHYLAEDPWFEWQILTGPKLRLNYVDYNSLLSDIMTIQSGGNVGIGESNPQANLHIGRSASAVPGTVARIAIQPYMIQSATWMITARDDGFNAHLDLSNGLTNVLTLRNDGNVGIGNTAPQYDLDIGDGITSANLRIQKAGGDTIASATIGYLEIMSSGNNADTNLINTYEGSLAGYGDITLNPARAGNVGIGTLAPNYKLDLRTGGAVYDPNGVEWQQFIGPESVAEDVIGDGIGLRLGFAYDHNGKAAGIAAIAEDGWANSVGLGLFTGTSAPTEKVRITAAGDVGIGIPNPGGKLDVDGSFYVGSEGIYDRDDSIVNIKEDLIVEGGTILGANGEGITLGVTDNVIAFTSGGSERIRVHTNGNIGIRETNPQQELIVDGNVGIGGYNSASQTAALAVWGNVGIGTDMPQHELILASGSIVGIGYNDVSQTATLAVNGEVGIGTTTPNAELDINGGIALEIHTITDDYTVNDRSIRDHTVIGMPKDEERIDVTLPDPSSVNEGQIVIITNDNLDGTVRIYRKYKGSTVWDPLFMYNIYGQMNYRQSMTFQSDGVSSWYMIDQNLDNWFIT